MSATIREADIPDVIALLSDFAGVDRVMIRKTLTEDEIDFIYQRRRDALRALLQNKGITLKQDVQLSVVTSTG